MELIDLVLKAGRSAVELSLFVLLPIMVVMLCLMRLLEARGVMDWAVARLAPVLRPAGLTGLSVFAALQISFVSFAAPVATLAMMEGRGASDRHLAATLAMVFAMGQANVMFPMAALDLRLGLALALSLAGGLLAAAATFYCFGRGLSTAEKPMDETLKHPVAEDGKGILDVINRAGAEAFRIAVGVIPMLVLSLVAITFLRQLGLFAWLTGLLAPLLAAASIDPAMIPLTLTKALAGGTAVLGLMNDMHRDGTANASLVNGSAGWLIHTLDVPGVAILISAGKRVARVCTPAVLGGCVGIALRTAGHAALG
ncbi:nucleoside recognition family protein [Massilia dura]|uniref:Nucleoside recognition family protein n=1 Tax=Pseudoduganella dura TaxID=321982 RepID=A0A6I3XLM5_9BURK|nr:nucleoside recognition domain-containing protein [Pseudoduganella dura]MUI15343.1 nucleoside recognition family protein [Pseudoduganella dura]